jgi:hypothetical protein
VVGCQARAVHMQGLMVAVQCCCVLEVPLASACDVAYAAALAVSQQAVDLHFHALAKVASCVGLLAFFTDTCSAVQTGASASCR